ncbi:PEP/pyruvate-binding domain-containing protein [Amycolatopsis eburnea]|uniref:Uncharacterized protein n=1 Tax=Amycolatopsis eburnea TaxID=2267691 RepID=A0A3R9F732_9PSEU|nr:PEP/pyruvate-binding domain-containing protein [Amycolatopsis eburnea]RSD19472.1 hypothetical protein EIY87_14300 [Amycolatopsis eburnea]
MCASRDGESARPSYPAAPDEVRWLPVTAEGCDDDRFAGPGVRALHRAAAVTTVPETVVLTAPVPHWRELARRPDPLAGYADLVEEPVSVRAWWPRAGQPDVPIGPVFHNLGPGTVAEGMLELIGRAEDGPRGFPRLAFAVQRFTAAEATVLAQAAPDGERVRLQAFLGLAEQLAEPLHPDLVVLAGPLLAVHEYRVADKPTATLAAAGGTRTVATPELRRRAPVLRVAALQEIATLTVAVARRLDGPVATEFAVAGGKPLLLSCRPRP